VALLWLQCLKKISIFYKNEIKMENQTFYKRQKLEKTIVHKEKYLTKQILRRDILSKNTEFELPSQNSNI